jgi:hypothetical protein
MNRRLFHRSVALSFAAVTVFLAGLASAGSEAPSFKRRSDNEKRFAGEVAEAIIKAAHSTAKKPSLVSHEYVNPKANRTELKLKMEYVGAVTNKKYLANATVKIDSSDKNAWEVLSIDYSDNNNVPHSRKKLEELVKHMNR